MASTTTTSQAPTASRSTTYSTSRPSYRTLVHFEALLARVASTPDHPVFKLPDPAAPGTKWVDVSYKQFEEDLSKLATYWSKVLGDKGIPPRSVVGIWLRGFTYADVLTVIALSRASFVPQLFGFELPNTRIVYTLLSTYSGRAIIHDPAKSALLAVPPKGFDLLPCFVAPIYTDLTDERISELYGGAGNVRAPEYPRLQSGDDWTFIYHSSGSVSGMPKVVPNTNAWLETIEHKSPEAFAIGWSEAHRGTDVYLWTESFSHSMEICLFLLIMHHTASLVQPTRIDFSSAELCNMVKHAGVNRIIQFTNVLRTHLEDARGRSDEFPELLGSMKAARQVTYAGMPLPSELEDWAIGEGIKITNNFGCTECGQLFSSTFGDRTLKLLPTVHAAFIPVSDVDIDDINNGHDNASTPPLSASPSTAHSPSSSTASSDDETPSLRTPSTHSQTAPASASTSPKLYELLILPTSPDLPIPNLRTDMPAGVVAQGEKGWKSGDLFEKVVRRIKKTKAKATGSKVSKRGATNSNSNTNNNKEEEEEVVEEERYIFRGRDDDWIKSLLSEKLDTRSIEDTVYRRCPDLVANCVVVGNGRPQPAIFIEVLDRVVRPDAEADAEAEQKPNEDAAAAAAAQNSTKTTGSKAKPSWWTTPAVQRRIEDLKVEIIARIKDDMELKYLHERIEDVRMVMIVPHKTLPRTAVKGNIRRRAIEEQFADEIEAMYASLPIEEIYASILDSPDAININTTSTSIFSVKKEDEKKDGGVVVVVPADGAELGVAAGGVIVA